MSAKEQNALLAIFGQLRKKDRVFLLALANSLKGKVKYRNHTDDTTDCNLARMKNGGAQ